MWLWTRDLRSWDVGWLFRRAQSGLRDFWDGWFGVLREKAGTYFLGPLETSHSFCSLFKYYKTTCEYRMLARKRRMTGRIKLGIVFRWFFIFYWFLKGIWAANKLQLHIKTPLICLFFVSSLYHSFSAIIFKLKILSWSVKNLKRPKSTIL